MILHQINAVLLPIIRNNVFAHSLHILLHHMCIYCVHHSRIYDLSICHVRDWTEHDACDGDINRKQNIEWGGIPTLHEMYPSESMKHDTFTRRKSMSKSCHRHIAWYTQRNEKYHGQHMIPISRFCSALSGHSYHTRPKFWDRPACIQGGHWIALWTMPHCRHSYLIFVCNHCLP